MLVIFQYDGRMAAVFVVRSRLKTNDVAIHRIVGHPVGAIVVDTATADREPVGEAVANDW